MTSKAYKNARTLSSIAELAGVSTAAVSVVMREEMGYPVKSGRMKFSKRTREKILKTVKETGYKPNVFSRALVSGKSGLIGYIHQPEFTSFTSEYTLGIEDQAASRRYGTLMVTVHQNSDDDFNPFDLMLEKRADGLILMCDADKLVTPETRSKIETMSVPVVYIGHIPKKRVKNSGSVCVNGRMVGMMAATHLFELGHKHVACINTADWAREGVEYAAEGSSANVEYWSIDRTHATPMEEVAKRWLDMSNRPTGLYVNGDYNAISLINLLTIAGIKIPEEVSIIGNDGLEMGKDSIVPLTTINQPKYEQGTESAKLLFELIQGGQTHDIILDPNLEVRKSTARPQMS